MAQNPTKAHGFGGVWTALVTPFNQKFEIDWDAYEKLLERQKAAGVKGVVVSGTTGEAPTLAVQEKLALVRKAKALLGDSVRIMAGTGGNNTNQSVELSKLAEDAGADSLLIVTPPYNKPTISGLIHHFETIAKSVSIPLCLYHVPGRTAQLLSATDLARLCEISGIDCVKEASADLGLFSRAYNGASEKTPSLCFLSGDDPTYLPSLSVGGQGVISVVSNLFPEAMVQMTEFALKGHLESALNIHKALLPLIDALFCESNPSPTKAAFKELGWSEETVRAPLVPLEDDSRRLIKTVLKETKSRLESL